MKWNKRIPALLLALVLVLTALTGCGGKKPIDTAPPHEVAVALFDILLRDDASAITKALNYPSEAEARADFGSDDGSLYEAIAGEVATQLNSLGMGAVTNEDTQRLVNAFLSMMGKLTFTAETKEQNDKERTATVTCHISSFPADAVETAMTEAMTDLVANNPDLLSDPDNLISVLVETIVQAMEALEPGDDLTDFDAEFSLQKVDVNGEAKWVWIPTDVEAFGAKLSSTALGG